jgi:hypothetical protein
MAEKDRRTRCETLAGNPDVEYRPSSQQRVLRNEYEPDRRLYNSGRYGSCGHRRGVAALAAWRSATASERTARGAMEGLANTIKPSVSSRGVYNRRRDDRLFAFVVVANRSKWDATDVTAKIRRRNNDVYEKSAEWLRGENSGDLLEIEIGEIDPTTPEGHAGLVVSEITIWFRDGRGIASYRRIEDWASTTPTHLTPVTTEERLELTTAIRDCRQVTSATIQTRPWQDRTDQAALMGTALAAIFRDSD